MPGIVHFFEFMFAVILDVFFRSCPFSVGVQPTAVAIIVVFATEIIRELKKRRRRRQGELYLKIEL